MDGRPDLILLDLSMPQLDGFEVIERLKVLDDPLLPPIVILTALQDRDTLLKALDVGARDLICKPFDTREVIHRIRSQLLAHLLLQEKTAQTQVLEELVAERTRELHGLNLFQEEQIRQRTAQLETFNYAVSHDLRAPLRVVTNLSRAVVEDFGAELPEEARLMIERVQLAGITMGGIINGLLALSGAGRRELKRVETDLTNLAHDVWREVAFSSSEREVRFEVQEGIVANCDATLMRQVLQNLLANAFKFTRDARSAHVSFGAIEADGEIRYFVCDNGAGFDMNHAEKLFKPFQRLHKEHEFEGSGIGLATVRTIIEHHGGRIWASSSLGKGSEFCFTLG